jgi:hypothetical protein
VVPFVHVPVLGVAKVVLANHPSYDLSLGIDADAEKGDMLHRPSPGDGSFDGYIWASVARPFFISCWVAAGGPNSGMRAILFENGIGDEVDLGTGKPPED